MTTHLFAQQPRDWQRRWDETLPRYAGRWRQEGESRRFILTLDSQDLPDASAFLFHELSAQLAITTAVDKRGQEGSFLLYYTFSLPEEGVLLTLMAPVAPDRPHFPSVTPRVPAAHWGEREIRDLFGLHPVGHPDPRPLVLHRDWAKGVHPLRKDVSWEELDRRQVREFPYLSVEGDAVTEVPVGPIHAGIIEPGHFRFSAVGEHVIHLEAQLFYTHRGIEKLLEGRDIQQALPMVERICGWCSVTHAENYAQALEHLAGVEVPAKARYHRVILLELERLYNHLNDLSAICAGTGQALGSQQLARLKEELMAVNERWTGNRFLRGALVLGGIRREPDARTVRSLRERLPSLGEEVGAVVEDLLRTESFLDRVEGTGRLDPQWVRDLGGVGVAARAAGARRDLRADHPYEAYGDFPFTVAVETTGDVAARLKVRAHEVRESVGILTRALDGLPQGPLRAAVQGLPANGWAYGWAESPRGSDFCFVAVGEGDRIERYHLRSASYSNWPSVAMAVPGNIIPDFPLINKSFELCYACCDR